MMKLDLNGVGEKSLERSVMLVYCPSEFSMLLLRQDIRALQNRKDFEKQAKACDVVGHVPQRGYHASEKRMQDRHHAQYVRSEVFHMIYGDMLCREPIPIGGVLRGHLEFSAICPQGLQSDVARI